MEQTFGARLMAARKRAGFRTQQALGDAVGVSGKTIRNYEGNRTAPERIDPETLAKIRRLVGEFDLEGDPVEVALKQSRLVEDRQLEVLKTYKRELRYQDAEESETEGRAG